MAGSSRSVSIIRSDRDRSRDFLADVSHGCDADAALLSFNELLKDQAADPARAGSSTRAASSSSASAGSRPEPARALEAGLGLVLLDLRPDDLRAAVESSVEQAKSPPRRR
jgi:hypothetical protein